MLCHTTHFVVFAVCYRSNAGKGMPSRLCIILFFIARVVFLDHLEFGGVSYRYKFEHYGSVTFERPEYGDFLGYLTPSHETTDPRSHSGKIYWAYAVSVMSCVAGITSVGGLWHNRWALLIQVGLVLGPLFQPANYMLGGGSVPSPGRTMGMHMGHAANYLIWQTNFFIWFFYGCNKEWTSAYTCRRETKIERKQE